MQAQAPVVAPLSPVLAPQSSLTKLSSPSGVSSPTSTPPAVPPASRPKPTGMPVENALLALAYVLLLASVAPGLAAYDSPTWAAVPTMLVVAGYSAAVLKNFSAKEEGKRLERVQWLAWVVYYTLSIVWPLPMHWYDSLVIITLITMPDNLRGSVLMAVYYLLSGADAMAANNVLQTCGRGLLLALTTHEVMRTAGQVRDGVMPAV